MKITPTIARIHAHICGDGCVFISKQRRSPGSLLKHKRRKLEIGYWKIAYYNTSKVLLDQFGRDIKSAFNRKPQYRRHYYEVSINGAKHIAEKLQVSRKSTKNWFIPDFIMKGSEKIISNWLRAFFDDEGCITKRKRDITASSINLAGLKSVKKMLMKLSIESKIYGPRKRFRKDGFRYNDCYIIRIKSAFFNRYAEKVGFMHPKKRYRLKRTQERFMDI